MDRKPISRTRLAGAAGLVAGMLAGVLTVVAAGAALAHQLAPDGPDAVIEATHLPPLLTAPGEQVELRYDVFCAAAGSEVDTPCKATGSVFVRPGQAGPFRELELRDDGSPSNGRFGAEVPTTIARSASGFSYYAVLRSAETGASVTLPAGGAAAPQQSLPLDRAVSVSLGAHPFGRTAAATARVAEAAWGEGAGEVGLEQGRNLPPIGGSGFDVSRDGTVHVLDEANRRVLRWRARAHTAAAVPLAINGTLADMSVSDDGTIFVLETTERSADAQLLRTFAANGAARSSLAIGERASQVRLGADGLPVVLQQPSGQWTAVTAANGNVLSPAEQRLSGRSGRPQRDGGEVVVLRRDAEIRVAFVSAKGVRRSWRIASETPVAEVQLAEPLGNRLVVVARVYSDAQDEFVALVLGPAGLERRLALDSADWAEAAPLSRFRLVGSSLFQLGSTPAHVFVDRFDLEVR
jgi:hypothetical protein